MYHYKIKIFSAVFLVLLFSSSCKKSFFTDVNKNPNVVSSVTPNLLLPSAEIALAFTQGGDLSRYTSLITQQTFGAQNQTQTFYQYGINPGTFENGWSDLYTSTMENAYTLKQIADQGGNNRYSGISRILLGYCLQLAVDLWGKVPYSEAFHGNISGGSLSPKYDDDKALYDTIASLVDVGNTFLANANPGLLVPTSTEDVIYSGDASKWMKFGHAIKARLYIHQSKGDAAMASKALAETALAFTSSADNAVYNFLGNGNTQNPNYQFLKDRQAYVTYSNSTLATQLKSTNDPRYSILIDPTHDVSGDPSGNHFGGLGDFYGSANSPVEFITYSELLFIKAEATLRATGDYATAQGYYKSAIQANMQKLGVAAASITTYTTAQGTLPITSVDAAIARVASQEFIALYLNPEAFTLYRRTGVPNLSPTGPGAVPRRLIYPQSEYSYNAANVPASTLYSPKIFWDK